MQPFIGVAKCSSSTRPTEGVGSQRLWSNVAGDFGFERGRRPISLLSKNIVAEATNLNQRCLPGLIGSKLLSAYPLSPGSDDLERRVEREECQLESDLRKGAEKRLLQLSSAWYG